MNAFGVDTGKVHFILSGGKLACGSNEKLRQVTTVEKVNCVDCLKEIKSLGLFEIVGGAIQ